MDMNISVVQVIYFLLIVQLCNESKIKKKKKNFGIFKDVIELIKFKVETMDPVDKFCILSYDEMLISEQLDYDKLLGKFVGYATLGRNLMISVKQFLLLLVE